VLAGFYLHAPRARWTGAEYRSRLRDTMVDMAGELVRRGAPPDRIAALVEVQHANLDHEAATLEARIGAGRVVEAHGDLRPEHVCLETPPVVIDPLEFDEDLRTLDAASELAFFALECERLGARWFGDTVIARYAELAGDAIPAALARLYRIQHVLARALLALRHLDDVPAEQHPKWHARARDYLARVTSVVA
jgi:uncharacterized protein